MIIFLFSVLKLLQIYCHMSLSYVILSYEEKRKKYEDKKYRNKKYYSSVSWK